MYFLYLLLALITCGLYNPSFAMVYDNRYFPWYSRTISKTLEKPSYGSVDAFFCVSNGAFLDTDDSIGIPTIWGKYDQNKLANAFEVLGKPNPLLPSFSDLIGKEIIWKMHGSLQAQGIAFAYHQQLCDYLSVGISWFFMHLFSKVNFSMSGRVQQELNLNAVQVIDLDHVRRSMQQELLIKAPVWNVVGMSDIDLYVRFGKIWEYCLNFKRIDTGFKFGFLVPTGKQRDPNNPASVPFGGDGMWGIYVAGDAELELKEDWKAGLLLRMNQRFTKSRDERLPIAGEQPLFGAIEGNAKVFPGLTFVVAPYFRLEDIRDGLGVQAKYTVVKHFNDLWKDARLVKSPLTTLQNLNKFSEWAAEYITIDAFYDFSRVRTPYRYAPLLSLMWDIPVHFFAAERVAKTHRISLGLVVTF